MKTDIGNYLFFNMRVIGEQGMADVHLTDMVNVTTGEQHGDLAYEDMSVIDGQFGRHHADDHRLSGAFYGPNHEEAGGYSSTPPGTVGAYGGDRD